MQNTKILRSLTGSLIQAGQNSVCTFGAYTTALSTYIQCRLHVYDMINIPTYALRMLHACSAFFMLAAHSSIAWFIKLLSIGEINLSVPYKHISDWISDFSDLDNRINRTSTYTHSAVIAPRVTRIYSNHQALFESRDEYLSREAQKSSYWCSSISDTNKDLILIATVNCGNCPYGTERLIGKWYNIQEQCQDQTELPFLGNKFRLPKSAVLEHI